MVSSVSLRTVVPPWRWRDTAGGRGGRSPLRRIGWPLGLALLLAALGACDSGPSGPGALDALVEGPEEHPGAALLLVSGEGIQGFQASGQVELHYEPAGDTDGSYRVLVVNPEDGPLEFQVRVRDLAGPRPSGRLLEGADGDNRSLDPEDLEQYRVRFFR